MQPPASAVPLTLMRPTAVTIRAGPKAAVRPRPTMSAGGAVAPPVMSSSVLATTRLWVDAPTAAIHGPTAAVVAGPGPALPAETEAAIPAARRLR